MISELFKNPEDHGDAIDQRTVDQLSLLFPKQVGMLCLAADDHEAERLLIELADRVDACALPVPEKQRLIGWIRRLPPLPATELRIGQMSQGFSRGRR